VSGLTLVNVGKIHAVGKLQSGNLPRMVLDFEVCLHDSDVNDLALFGVFAFYPDAIQLQIAIIFMELDCSSQG